MESTRLVLVLALFWTRTTGDLDQDSSALKVDLSVAVRRVDRRFLSVTIDASLAAEERFMSLLSSPKVRTLAKALSPSFLRFGGTRQDFMVFTPQGVRQDSEDPAGASCDGQQLPVWLEDRLKKDWTRQQLTLMKEDLQGKYRRVQYTGHYRKVEAYCQSQATERKGPRDRKCSAAALQSQTERVSEPNSFEKKAGVRVDGEQLGRDFTLLRALMSRSPWQRHAGLYGPDIGQPRDHRAPLLEG
ncbi:Heparanase [Liparis tanakae]|uniref:Heparanase n=1 Tax=Liparis tanakae TaxID=230148 RepID=A0A4Z2GUD0_9TELE|nr:Heparanase [Liparis tanakae]